MDNNIYITLKDNLDLYSRYSNDIKDEFLDYIISKAKYKKGKFKIVINTNLKIDDLESIIKKSLREYYLEYKMKDRYYNIKQLIFFIIGLLFLIISVFLKEAILNNLAEIAGWIAIWKVLDISLKIDYESRIIRKSIKKILKSRIIVKDSI